MSAAIWPAVRGVLGTIFKPELKTRRVLEPGFSRANIALLGVVTAVVLLLAVGLTGQTFSLYLPNYFSWQWIDVTILEFP
ncbi:MAG: hypothetical protein VW644_12185, partial [Alphaproteobacteria bacterium]